MGQQRNVFNDWQKFCATNKCNSETARCIYVLRKKQIKASESNWSTILQDFNRQRDKINEESNEYGLEANNIKNHNANEKEIPSSIVDTLREIKSLLLYLSSEPARKVRSFIKLEDDSNQLVHQKWRKGICGIMSEVKPDEVISLKKIFELLREKIIDIDLGSMNVKFIGIDDTVSMHFQVLFKKKREEFYNEIIIPIIAPNNLNSESVTIYMLYNTKELFSIIDSAYSTEMSTRKSVLTTTTAEILEKEFFITRIIYFILHAMIHLKCALKYGNSFMTHNSHEYFDLLQVTVPPPLYVHFLQPYTAAVYNNSQCQ